MTVFVNGEARELREGATVGELLDKIGTARTGVAVACNEQIVRRGSYGERHLAQGDRVEIIKAVAGG